MLLEYSTAASNTRLLLTEKGMSVAERGGAPAEEAASSSSSFQMLRTASRALVMVMPEPRNPSGERSSAIRPRSKCWVKTMSFPRAKASLWEKMTDLMARSVKRSKAAEMGCLRRDLRGRTELEFR